MLILEVFGTPNHKVVKSISSSGKSIFIDFKKQSEWGDDENASFRAKIKYKKINSDCQALLDTDKNILTSPNHPNNINCSWLISSNFESYIILNFTFIEVNSYFLWFLVKTFKI